MLSEEQEFSVAVYIYTELCNFLSAGFHGMVAARREGSSLHSFIFYEFVIV